MRVRLSISALRHYLECPLQGAARYALGMREDEDGDDEYEDEEPIERSGLDECDAAARYALARQRKGSPISTIAMIEIYHARILDGLSRWVLLRRLFAPRTSIQLDHAITQANGLKIKNLDRWQRIAIGGVEEFSDVDQTLDPIVLDVDFLRADGRRVTSIELRGLIGPVSPRLDRSFKLVARDYVKTADFLKAALEAIVLAAAGSKMPAEFVSVVLGAEEKKKVSFERTIAMPTRDAARAWLTRLATDLLSGGNDYFLPIEAVDAVRRNKFSNIDLAIRSVRDSKQPACRSDFGPVRKEHARNFRIPINEIEHGLIVHRFGPLIAIFDHEQEPP